MASTKEPTRVATLAREVRYASDPTSVETAISYDSAYRLCDDSRYFRIEGAGEGTLVRVDHISFIIEALQEIVELDEQAHN